MLAEAVGDVHIRCAHPDQTAYYLPIADTISGVESSPKTAVFSLLISEGKSVKYANQL